MHMIKTIYMAHFWEHAMGLFNSGYINYYVDPENLDSIWNVHMSIHNMPIFEANNRFDCT